MMLLFTGCAVLLCGALCAAYLYYRKLVHDPQALESSFSIRTYPDDSSDYFLNNEKVPSWMVPFIWMDTYRITGFELVRDYRNSRGEIIQPTKEWDSAFRAFYVTYRAARFEYGGRLRRARQILEEAAPFSWMEEHYVAVPVRNTGDLRSAA